MLKTKYYKINLKVLVVFLSTFHEFTKDFENKPDVQLFEKKYEAVCMFTILRRRKHLLYVLF